VGNRKTGEEKHSAAKKAKRAARKGKRREESAGEGFSSGPDANQPERKQKKEKLSMGGGAIRWKRVNLGRANI